MEPLTVVLIIVCGILLAGSIFLIIRYFKGMTDEQKANVIAKCNAAVKIIIAAAADGKITSAELMQIANALIAVISSLAGKTTDEVSDELGATEYINTVQTEEQIVVSNTNEGEYPIMKKDVFNVMTSNESDYMKEKLWNEMAEHEKNGETHYTIHSDKWEYQIRNGQYIANPIYAK